VISHGPPLVLGRVLRLEHACGQDAPLTVCTPASPPWATVWRSHTRCGRGGVDGPHPGSGRHGRSAALGGPGARRGARKRSATRSSPAWPPCGPSRAAAPPRRSDRGSDGVCAVPDRCSRSTRCPHGPGWSRPRACREVPSEAPPCVATDRCAPRWPSAAPASVCHTTRPDPWAPGREAGRDRQCAAGTHLLQTRPEPWTPPGSRRAD
jgi:hypothetical protein